MSAHYDCVDSELAEVAEVAEVSCRPGACGHRQTVQVATKRQAKFLAGGYTISADVVAADVERVRDDGRGLHGNRRGAGAAGGGRPAPRGQAARLNADALVATARTVLE